MNDQDHRMKREEYSLHVSGVFGRNRKPKFKTFVLFDVEAGSPVDTESLNEAAKQKMAEIKLKSGRVKVKKTPFDLDFSNGFVIKTMMISLSEDNTVIDLGSI